MSFTSFFLTLSTHDTRRIWNNSSHLATKPFRNGHKCHRHAHVLRSQWETWEFDPLWQLPLFECSTLECMFSLCSCCRVWWSRILISSWTICPSNCDTFFYTLPRNADASICSSPHSPNPPSLRFYVLWSSSSITLHTFRERDPTLFISMIF